MLKTLLEELHQKISNFEDGVQRDLKFPKIPNKIMAAIGMRRTGKTYFLFQTIKTLLKETPITRILYINFEDDRLLPMDQKKLASLLDSFYSLYPVNHDELCYIFLDEIQNVEGWPTIVRRFFDTKKVKIYLTGSSAKLLSTEIATSLRGRSIAIEVWPFSFSEFLQAKGYMTENSRGKIVQDKLLKELKTYLEEGGFPEALGLEKSDRRQLLQGYVSLVVLRDIIERYQITNIALIKYMIKMLIKNVGCSFSSHKFFNDLKSQGFSVAKTTIYEYLDHIQDAYLIFTVPLYSESLRKIQTNPKKIYAIDTGIARDYSLSMSENIGHHFENLIFLDLKRQGHQIHYYLTKSRNEVDFLSCDREGNWHLYQVCWNPDNFDTWQREIRALKEAEEELGIQGIIITPENYLSIFKNLGKLPPKDLLLEN